MRLAQICEQRSRPYAIRWPYPPSFPQFVPRWLMIRAALTSYGRSLIGKRALHDRDFLGVKSYQKLWIGRHTPIQEALGLPS